MVRDRRERILAAVACYRPETDPDSAHTHDRVLRTAVKLFAELGFESCTMRHLASGADVTPSALYNHFTSKDQILAEALWLAVGDFFDVVLGPLGDEPQASWLEMITRRHVIHQIENRETALANDLLVQSQALRRHMPQPAQSVFWTTGRDYFEIVRALVGDAAGRNPDSRLTVDAYAMIASCDRVSTWYRPDGPMSPGEIAEETWSMVQRITGR